MFKAMILTIEFFVTFILSVVITRKRYVVVEHAAVAAVVTFITWCFMSFVPDI